MATFCHIFFSNAQGRQLPGQLFILVWSEITCIVRPTEHLILRSIMTLWALSIQQKFQFEILEIPRAQWNGTFLLHRPDPSHRALGYCSCKQDTKERYWGQQFCQMERNISVRPTEMTRPVKEDHLQSWSRIFRSDQTEMVCSIWCSNWNYRNFGLNGKRPMCLNYFFDQFTFQFKI